MSENFRETEFECPEAGPVPPELQENLRKLVKNLQALRNEVGLPIRVISAYRSPAYNKKIGGAPKSQHMSASAADIKINGMSPAEVAATIERLIAFGKMEEGGLGVYETFVHYDVRGRKSRWGGE